MIVAIQEDYPAPTGFLKSREQARSEFRVISNPTPVNGSSRVGGQRKGLESAPAPVPEIEKHFDVFWNSISDEEKETFEKNAFDHAQPFNQRFYLEKRQSGGVLFSTVQRRLLLDYFATLDRVG